MGNLPELYEQDAEQRGKAAEAVSVMSDWPDPWRVGCIFISVALCVAAMLVIGAVAEENVMVNVTETTIVPTPEPTPTVSLYDLVWHYVQQILQGGVYTPQPEPVVVPVYTISDKAVVVVEQAVSENETVIQKVPIVNAAPGDIGRTPDQVLKDVSGGQMKKIEDGSITVIVRRGAV